MAFRLGGKKALRDAVLARFPPYYERYIEVFGGAGWILFHKPPDMDFEVYNDFNSNLVNLYRCVRNNPNKLKYKLRYVLNSREDFDWITTTDGNTIPVMMCCYTVDQSVNSLIMLNNTPIMIPLRYVRRLRRK